MLSLFDPPEPENEFGIPNILPKDGEAFYFPNFFSKRESELYLEFFLKNIRWQQDQIKFFGKLIDIPRLTAWYGDADKTYTYSGIPMNPHPWLPELLAIKRKVEKVAKVEFSSVLLNLYRDGKDGVAWHSDDEQELGLNPIIGSVSLGATRVFKLRHLKDKSLIKKIELSSGSFLLMRGSTQHQWEHEVPKTSTFKSPRVNLTFRVIR